MSSFCESFIVACGENLGVVVPNSHIESIFVSVSKKHREWVHQDDGIDPEIAIGIVTEGIGDVVDLETGKGTEIETVIEIGIETGAEVETGEGNGKRHHRSLMVIK